MNYESTRKRLPAANDRSAQGTAGWSWIVQILPFIEEVNLYNTLSSNSSRFATDYSATVASTQGNTGLSQLICPSSTVTSPNTSLTSGQQALTNYKGCAAASLISATEPASVDNGGAGVLTKHVWSNNPTLSAGVSYGGIDLRQVADGLSKTVMIGETCEGTTNAAWAQGQTAWITMSDSVSEIGRAHV